MLVVVVAHSQGLRNKALITTGRGELLLPLVEGARVLSLGIKPIALPATTPRVIISQ